MHSIDKECIMHSKEEKKPILAFVIVDCSRAGCTLFFFSFSPCPILLLAVVKEFFKMGKK
jgi:hypothetical protein